MQSVMNEITALRRGEPITVDYRNSNRYRLVVSESNGTKTAYYFATPIYNLKSRKLIDLRFKSNGEAIFVTGSNADIAVSDQLRMENAEGSCVVGLPQHAIMTTEKEIRCGAVSIFPTTNGAAYRVKTKGTDKFGFTVESDQPFLNTHANDRCFALMKEQFRPFAVFSVIGAMDAAYNLIAPGRIEYQKLTDKKYLLTVCGTSPLGAAVLFEANLYENKLFQDTTVESKNPSINNAFGSVGFVGDTALYGEQWLYSRPDYSKMSEIMDKRLQKAILHIPKFSHGDVELSAYKVAARFCSFGSSWDNKIAGVAHVSDSTSFKGYQSLDVTSMLADERTRTLRPSEGLILKSKVRGSGFSAIATGDSYYAPQILEIRYD